MNYPDNKITLLELYCSIENMNIFLFLFLNEITYKKQVNEI